MGAINRRKLPRQRGRGKSASETMRRLRKCDTIGVLRKRGMSVSNGKCWESTNVYLVAAWRCCGHELLDIYKRGDCRVIFVFQDSPKLRADLRAFFTRQLQMEALSYASAIHETKAAVFSV